MAASTESGEYADRLVTLQGAWWKRILPVQAPYRWNLRRLHLGRTLEIGCGIGRNLAHLGAGAVGVDHNPTAVAFARSMGFEAFTAGRVRGVAVRRARRASTACCSPTCSSTWPGRGGRRSSGPISVTSGPAATSCSSRRRSAGYRSDATHVEFTDFDALRAIARDADLTVDRRYSFPFPAPPGARSCTTSSWSSPRTPGAAAR